MHFQVPPHAHQKLVYCVQGHVLDVVLDLRRESKTYGSSASFELSSLNHQIAYIPSGFAHGFLSLEEDTCMIYKTDCVYSADHDAGIAWDSFGFDWPSIDSLVVSERDSKHPEFQDFNSPFSGGEP